MHTNTCFVLSEINRSFQIRYNQMQLSTYTKHNLDLHIQIPHGFKSHEASVPSRLPHASSYSERAACFSE